MAVQQSLIWNTNEGSTQVQQYLDGAMNAQQLAAALEKDPANAEAGGQLNPHV